MPISEKRLAANRRNALKSTGPKSAQGKLNTSRNGFKHGLLAKTILLDGESRSRFQEILDSLVDEFQPTTGGEYSFVEKAAVYQWRLLRSWMFDAISIRNAMNNQTGAEAQLDLPTRAMLAARSLNENSRQAELNSRFEHRFDLQHHRALRTLQRMKAEKLAGTIQSHQPEENKESESPMQTHQNPLETQ